jgi:hypothetical protein
MVGKRPKLPGMENKMGGYHHPNRHSSSTTTTHPHTLHAQICHHRQTLKRNRNQNPKTCQKAPQTCKEAAGSTKNSQSGLEEGPQNQDNGIFQ